MEADLGGVGARRNVVRAAKRRDEVVQRVLVPDVDRGQSQTPLVAIAVKEIILPERQVEQIPRRDARWIVVIILRAGRGDLHQRRAVHRPGAQICPQTRADWRGRRGDDRTAEQSRLELLVWTDDSRAMR